MDRYKVVTSLASIWFTILDCETDKMVEHEVENEFGVKGVMQMRFRNREAAEYHAAKMNEADKAVV